MDLDDIRPVSTRLAPSTPAEVAAAEAALGCRFPAGYAAYVERLGAGDLGHFLRVYPPERVLEARAEWQQRVTEYWFWEPGTSGATPEHLREGVVLADSFDGDELCFHPDDPDALFVLPRHSDDVHRVGPGPARRLLSGCSPPGCWSRPSPARWPSSPGSTAPRSGAGWSATSRRSRPRSLRRTRPPRWFPCSGWTTASRARSSTFPSIGGRAMLWWFADGRAEVVLRHDESAPADVVDRVVAVLDRHAAARPA